MSRHSSGPLSCCTSDFLQLPEWADWFLAELIQGKKFSRWWASVMQASQSKQIGRNC